MAILALTLYPPWCYTYQHSGVSQVSRPGPRALLFSPPAPEKALAAYGVRLDFSRLLLEWAGVGIVCSVLLLVAVSLPQLRQGVLQAKKPIMRMFRRLAALVGKRPVACLGVGCAVALAVFVFLWFSPWFWHSMRPVQDRINLEDFAKQWNKTHPAPSVAPGMAIRPGQASEYDGVLSILNSAPTATVPAKATAAATPAKPATTATPPRLLSDEEFMALPPVAPPPTVPPVTSPPARSPPQPESDPNVIDLGPAPAPQPATLPGNTKANHWHTLTNKIEYMYNWNQWGTLCCEIYNGAGDTLERVTIRVSYCKDGATAFRDIDLNLGLLKPRTVNSYFVEGGITQAELLGLEIVDTKFAAR
jgi:hypothetical protein